MEASPLICSASPMDWCLYDNGLRHERVKLRHKVMNLYRISVFHFTSMFSTILSRIIR